MRKIISSVLVLFSLNYYCHAQLLNGYTDKLSYRVGETVTFYTKSVQSSGVIQCSLLDINNDPIDHPINFTLSSQPGINTNEPWKNGYNYTSTATWTVPSCLKSGVYYLSAGIPISIIIKAKDKITADIVIVCPTNSANAYTTDTHYNEYGLTSIGMYGKIDTAGVLRYSPVVSFHRPLTNSNDYLHAGFLKWMYPAFPSGSHSLNVISDTDMEDYSEIENAKLLIIIGHNEYWTRQARINFDQYIDSGNDAMILSGNTMWWQVRLQADPNNSGNPQMVCYKGQRNGYNDDANITDTLLWTYHWNDPQLDYSMLASIGSQWPYGGYGVNCDVGTLGYKITSNASPYLKNTGLNSYGDIIPFPVLGSEMDGTLVTDLDGNGDPVLDAGDLGFYNAEMLGYIKMGTKYSLIMEIQKADTSGKIINVNSNFWCKESNFNNTKVQTITQNMIEQLLADSMMFVSQVNIGSGCDPSELLALKNGDVDLIQISPNPNKGEFMMNVFIERQQNFSIIIRNILGEVIFEKENLSTKCFEFDLSLFPKGIYFVNILQHGKLFSKKLIIQ